MKEVLEDYWAGLFEAILEGWLLDESVWPKNRTFQMFREWFEVETHAVLADLYQDEAIDYVE